MEEANRYDTSITYRLLQHKTDALEAYNNPDWFVIALQGSQNYGMAHTNSDIDSKLLVLPNVEDIVLNKKAISHTHVMPNNEHVDVKDVREYFKIFRKSNINFVEILFTDYFLVNENYTDVWTDLLRNREKIARINPYQAVSCMAGMASMKMKALDHPYPSRMYYIDKYGWDPKQLSHLLRIEQFTELYINGALYKKCIYLEDEEKRNYIKEIKCNGGEMMTLDEAKKEGNRAMSHILQMKESFQKKVENKVDKYTDALLNNILYTLIERHIRMELGV